MRPQTHPLEIRPDFERDPSGERLERLLAAQAAHAHATARRDFLACVSALLGIPVWLFAAGLGPAPLRDAGLILFPVLMIGFLVSFAAERWWSLRLRRAEREIAIRRSAT